MKRPTLPCNCLNRHSISTSYSKFILLHSGKRKHTPPSSQWYALCTSHITDDWPYIQFWNACETPVTVTITVLDFNHPLSKSYILFYLMSPYPYCPTVAQNNGKSASCMQQLELIRLNSCHPYDLTRICPNRLAS